MAKQNNNNNNNPPVRGVGREKAAVLGFIVGLFFGVAGDEAVRNYKGQDNIFSSTKNAAQVIPAVQPISVDYNSAKEIADAVSAYCCDVADQNDSLWASNSSLNNMIDSLTNYINKLEQTPVVTNNGVPNWKYNLLKKELNTALDELIVSNAYLDTCQGDANYYYNSTIDLENQISVYDSTIDAHNLGKYFKEAEPVNMSNPFWTRDKDCIIQPGGDEQ